MKNTILRTALSLCLLPVGFSRNADSYDGSRGAATIAFGPQQSLGQIDKNPSTPFLRYSRDGRLHAVWTEDHDSPSPKATALTQQHHGTGELEPSPMRNAVIASSTDGGQTWSAHRRVNSQVKAVQGEENGPKVAFAPGNKAYVVWSIPGTKGDKTRADIRFAMDDGKDGYTAARTVNEIEDTARFPMIEFAPDGNLMLAWIDRRIDNPKPRQLYLMWLGPEGNALTRNYSVGQGLCEVLQARVNFCQQNSLHSRSA